MHIGISVFIMPKFTTLPKTILQFFNKIVGGGDLNYFTLLFYFTTLKKVRKSEGGEKKH